MKTNLTELHTLNHQRLLDLIADPTNTVELRADAIKVLQSRGHRPLGIEVPDGAIETILRTVAPQRQQRSWWQRLLGRA